MERKYEITEKVICTGQVGNMSLNNIEGEIHGFTRFGTYYVRFGRKNSFFVLELHENQLIKISNEVVLIPSGEIISLVREKYYNYINKNIIRWDNEYKCYVIPDTLKNSLLF